MILMHRSLIIILLEIHPKPSSKDSGPGLCPLLAGHLSCLKASSFAAHDNAMKESRADICILQVRKLV